MPTIDGERVIADLKRLAEFGRYKTGVHRPTYSPIDVESRHWLAEKLGEAGLDTVIDGIGNVIGRNRSAGRRLLVGSHSETQPYGGWLDGSLGVIYALELARAFAADPGCAELGIDVAAWADEEGHYGNYLGSRSFTDALSEEEIDQTRGRDDGTPLRQALERALCRTAAERVDPKRYIGYLEAHIEQGDTLDTAGCASVSSRRSSASGITVSLIGEQNHAARPAWCGARMPEYRWFGSRPASTTAFPRSPARGRTIGRMVPSRTRPPCSRPRRDAGPVPRRRYRPARLSRGICMSSSAKPIAQDRAPARSRRSSEPNPVRWIPAFRTRSKPQPNATRRTCICGCRARRATTRRCCRTGCRRG
jgi:hypothetical protein